IAYWHHPPYTKGSHNSDSEGGLVDMRENALPVLEAGGVDLVLAGHSHSYERSFLIDGHYSSSSTLVPSMVVDGGDGRDTGDGAYQKPGAVAHQGAVYTVAGSSGKTSGGSLNHPAMFISLNVLGSVVLDLNANRLGVTFLDSRGAVRDTFSMLKPLGNQPPTVSAGGDQSIRLPSNASLDGNVSDDGLPNPPGVVTSLWSAVNGPGTVTFGNAGAIDTTASFSAPGTYVLRLTADDGGAMVWSDVRIDVQQGTGVIEVRVSARSDDAEESSSGSVKLGSTDLQLVRESSNQTVGMRFKGVTIPQGSVITNAYVQFQADEKKNQSGLLAIQAEAIDDAPTFRRARKNISKRARTTASVAWSPPLWEKVGEAGDDQRTPNIAAVIQEVVDRPGWASGNSLAIVITGMGKRVAESFNGAPAAAPLLHVEYAP
ncbi:MAG: PKD domain-containing protein, partial [Vicinamibacteria bacterium]